MNKAPKEIIYNIHLRKCYNSDWKLLQETWFCSHKEVSIMRISIGRGTQSG